MTTEKQNPAAEEKGTLELVQEGLTQTAREIWLAGVGVFATLDKEGTTMFNKFVERGRTMVENGKAPALNHDAPAPTYISEKIDQLTQEVVAKVGSAAQYVRNKFSELNESASATPPNEVKILTEKIDQLTAAVAALVQKLDENAKNGAKKTA